MMATGTIIVGRLLCSPVRDFLKKQKFLGNLEDYTESSGLVQREFLFRGSLEQVQRIQAAFKSWSDAMETA
jgi:hypothetical protein